MSKTTGTCPACFGTYQLSAKGTIIRHGWSVEGNREVGAYYQSWHTGPCFGVGYLPFEVSCQGTVDFFWQVIIPAGTGALARREALNARPVFHKLFQGQQIDWVRARSRSTPGYAVYAEFEVRIQDGDAAYEIMTEHTWIPSLSTMHVTRPRTIPSYEQVLEAAIADADAALNSVLSTAHFLSEKVCEWKPMDLGVKVEKVAVYHARSAKSQWFTACGRRTVGMNGRMVSRVATGADVTCPACRAKAVV